MQVVIAAQSLDSPNLSSHPLYLLGILVVHPDHFLPGGYYRLVFGVQTSMLLILGSDLGVQLLDLCLVKDQLVSVPLQLPSQGHDLQIMGPMDGNSAFVVFEPLYFLIKLPDGGSQLPLITNHIHTLLVQQGIQPIPFRLDGYDSTPGFHVYRN